MMNLSGVADLVDPLNLFEMSTIAREIGAFHIEL